MKPTYHLAAALLALALAPALAAAQELRTVQLVNTCLSPATLQVNDLLAAALAERGIRVVRRAADRLVVTIRPCNEFAFADRGPRDLTDAPRGPMGAGIAPPVTTARDRQDTQAELQLSITGDGSAKPRASITRKLDVPNGRPGWTMVPILVQPAADALVAALAAK